MKNDVIEELLVEVLNIKIEDAKKDLGIYDVDNWDSLSHMSLIVEIESKFDIELTGDEIAEMISFAKIKQIINLKLL